MTLSIDSSPCQLPYDAHININYNAAHLRSPNDARQGYVVEIVLPYSPDNDLIFNAKNPFNARPHTAELIHDGSTIIRGSARLLAHDTHGFRIQIRTGGARWAKLAALTPLDQLALTYTGYRTPSDIDASWSDERPVKFLPILRDSYEQINSSTDLQPVLRILSPDDYHPFIHLESLIRAIFTQGGYAIQSQFIQGELFRSLYISGAYPSRDTAAIEKRMGFHAIRLNSATATADNIGRVYATPHGAGDILGNIVQTATPLSVDELGVAHTEPYNNGNCFGLDGQKIIYRPRSVIAVGFEYHIRYTTQHRIISRDRLKGFDTINLGTGGNITFPLTNRYADRRNRLAINTSYRVVVFASADDAQYQLYYTYNGVPRSQWASFFGSTALATTSSAGTVADPELYVRQNGVWMPYVGDWALYDGHIAITGQTTVELTLRTPSQSLGPSSPKYFNTIFFAGADPGMSITLHTQCSLRPIFSPAPGYGERITASDVTCHNIKQIELLEATQHMFNLRFYTDEQTKQVYIEPEPDFWQTSATATTADWRGRTDLNQPITWQDVALEAHESRTYLYRSGDGVAARLEAQEGAPFDSWTAQTNSYATIEGGKRLINALFSPTINAAGGLIEAPSAQLMQVGDRDQQDGDGVNFAPRIVRYCGLRPLPDGERWPSTSALRSYPFAAFHHGTGSDSFTLCFGDRDQVKGLHRFYDREEAAITHQQHVTLTLRIEPHEMASLFTLGSGAPDLRWSFRITTDRGERHAMLSNIEKYNPAQGSAECTFTTLS